MAKLPTDVVRLLDQVIVRSPYGDLLGLELLEAAPDLARVRMPFRPEVTTVGDTVHGGAISALVDVAAKHPGGIEAFKDLCHREKPALAEHASILLDALAPLIDELLEDPALPD